MDEQSKPKDTPMEPKRDHLPKLCPKCGGTYPAHISQCPSDGTPLVAKGSSEVPTPDFGAPVASPRSATMVVDADALDLGEPPVEPIAPPPQSESAPEPGPEARADAPVSPPTVPPPPPTAPVVPSGDLKPLPSPEEAADPGASDSPPPDPLVGKLLRNKWEVLERVGSGSFGTVYKVRDVKGGWIDALKILSVDRLVGIDAENARIRFLREAQLVNRLGKESAHIVGLSTYEEDLAAGLIYFLMDFVEGKSLGEVVRTEGVFSPERAVHLALQVCDALIVAHEGDRPVVHRDLKLENIMLTAGRGGEEVAKVLDFGIAKIAERDQDSRLTEAGTSLGTPGFAAPEQLRAAAVDGRTDLFSFGVILYNILTGKDPWLGEAAGESSANIYELMVASERGEVKPIDETGVEVPPELAAIVLKLMERDPENRFASARELRTALQALDLPKATAPGAVRPTERVRRKKKALFDGGVGLLAPGAVGVLLILGLLAVRPWGRTLDLADLQARVAEGDVTEVRLDSGGFRGRVPALGFLSSPFTTPLGGTDPSQVVQEFRASGVDVDTSWEVNRLVDLAAQAQSEMRYFGGNGDDVQGYAQRMLALDPGSPEAQSLLLKVAERMAWDAEAAFEGGSTGVAQALLRDCRALVPGHPRCEAVASGG